MYYVHCDANAVALSGGNDVLLEKIRLAFDFMADEGAHDVKVKEVLGLKFVRTIQ